MKAQIKLPAQEPVRCPSRTSSRGKRGQRLRGPKALQRAAIPQGRRGADRRGRLRLRSGQEPRSAALGRKQPSFPLVLRAMLGSRHLSARGWGRSVFLLPSVLAVLAFACFPVGASADSVGVEYENAVPSPTGGHESAPTVVGGGDDDNAHASNNGGGATDDGGSGSGPGGSSEGGDAGTGTGQGAGEDKGGNGSTNPQHAKADKDAAGEIDTLEAVPASSQTTTSDEGGGSSPLVPILIVVALLAAISIGVVTWQRRRADAPISPKAG